MPTRCAWVGADEMLTAYHDREWGVPEFDGRALWESLMLAVSRQASHGSPS
jgi:DNA-3-methyladenine glycosylase I